MVLSYLATIFGKLSNHSLDAFEDGDVHSARITHLFFPLATRDEIVRHLADLTLLQERITTCHTSPYGCNSNFEDNVENSVRKKEIRLRDGSQVVGEGSSTYVLFPGQ